MILAILYANIGISAFLSIIVSCFADTSLVKEVIYITSASLFFSDKFCITNRRCSQLSKISSRARPCRRKLVAFSGLSLFHFTGLSHVRLGFI